MKDDKLYEKLKEFIAQAQHARECVWTGQLLDADQELDHLILDITNFSAERAKEEAECL